MTWHPFFHFGPTLILTRTNLANRFDDGPRGTAQRCATAGTLLWPSPCAALTTQYAAMELSVPLQQAHSLDVVTSEVVRRHVVHVVGDKWIALNRVVIRSIDERKAGELGGLPTPLRCHRAAVSSALPLSNRPPVGQKTSPTYETVAEESARGSRVASLRADGQPWPSSAAPTDLPCGASS